MKYKEEVVQKSFDLSVMLLELYVELVKQNEFELSQRILKFGTAIREHVDEASQIENDNDFIYKISLAYNDAVQARYWLKQLQMKHFIHRCCEDSVNQINEIISILAYLGQSGNKHRINLQYQMN